MVAEIFEALLQEVGHSLGGVKLEPDENNSCLIKQATGISIQMDLDPTGEFFIIGADLGTIPLGRYRADVFCQALKANAAPYPRYGTFAYSKQNDHLILFEMLAIRELTGEKIVSVLLPLGKKALTWQMSISQGEIPVIEISDESTGTLGGLFGLSQ